MNRPPDQALRPGSRFQIIRRLGEGGMGVVYEALDTERGGRVALKTLRAMEPEGLLLFKNEFRSLQGLHHTNLVSLGELIEEDGTWFFTMELVDGVDFLSYTRHRARFAQGTGDMVDEFASAATQAGSSDAFVIEPTVAGLSDRSSDAFVTEPTMAGPSDRSSEAFVTEPTMASDAFVTEPTLVPRAPTGHPGRVAPHPEDRPSAAFDETRLREALRELARGLVALHDAGKVHRDIKPPNIMVTDSGRVVLLDFGLVADVTRSPNRRELVGTAAYMSPEQAASRPPGSAADWYSVGVVLYEVLTGSLPFDGPPLELLHSKTVEDPLSPDSLVSGLPADLVELCISLLARDPEARPSGRTVLARLGERRASRRRRQTGIAETGAPFVGRKSEMAALSRAFARMQSGQASAALLHGPSGVGKSAILERYLQSLKIEHPTTVVLAGRCYERESVPYKAFDGVVDELSQFLVRAPNSADYLPRRVALLGQIFPVLQRLDKIAWAQRQDEALDPLELRARAFGALRELLARIAARQPLILAIDDLQWADSDSLQLLAELLAAPETPPLLLIATVREGSSMEQVGVRELVEAIPIEVDTLPINSLLPIEAVELASLLLGGKAEQASMIARESAGHPLFISVLAHEDKGGATGPMALDAALWARMERLPDAARELLELVAVSGLPVSQKVASRGLGISMSELAQRMIPLRAERLVQSTGTREIDSIEPYHGRVCDAVMQRLPAERLQEVHRCLSSALLEWGQADPERLAIHYRGAGQLELAAQAYASAARRAEEVLAFARAANFYDLALELSAADEPRRGEFRTGRAHALANAGHGAEAAKEYLLALEDAEEGQALDLRVRAAEQLLRSGLVDEGLELISSVLSTIGLQVPSTPKRALLSLLTTRARVRFRGLAFEESPEAEVPADSLRRIDACWSVALGLGHVDPIRGADVQARHLLLALQAGEPYRIARSLGAEAIFVATDGIGSKPRATALVSAADELAHKVGHPHALGMAAMARGLSSYFIGDWQPALEGCESAERIYRESCVGVAREQVTAQLFSLWSLSYLGRMDELGRRLHTWLREAETRSDRYAATTMRLGFMNSVWLAEDDVDRARREIKDAMGPWSHEGGMQYMDKLIALGQIDLYEGNAEAGRQRIVDAWSALRRALLLTVQVSRVEMRHLRGRSTLAVVAAGNSSASLLRAARRDAIKIRGEKVAWATPLGDLLLGGIAASRDDLDASLAATEAALAGFEAVDMALHAAVARRRLGEVRGGDEGRAAREAADAWMVAHGIREPERMTAMLAPGYAS